MVSSPDLDRLWVCSFCPVSPCALCSPFPSRRLVIQTSRPTAALVPSRTLQARSVRLPMAVTYVPILGARSGDYSARIFWRGFVQWSMSSSTPLASPNCPFFLLPPLFFLIPCLPCVVDRLDQGSLLRLAPPEPLPQFPLRDRRRSLR